MPSAAVLYVHPWGHLNDLVVPVGALSAMNAVDAQKLGRYAFEVTDDEIGAARIVALDLHWALGFSGLGPMIRRIRAVNPSASIVLGGASAGFYWQTLFDRFNVDYIVEGDAEVAFPALVRALLDGGTGRGIANVRARGGGAPTRQRISAERFDASDGLSTAWFPTLDRLSRLGYAAYPAGPVLLAARGCPMACPTCYGEIGVTLGDGWQLRSAAATVRELGRAAARRPHTLLVFLGKLPPAKLHALITTISQAGPFVFPQSVDLYLCCPPSVDDLGRLLAALRARITVSVIHPADRQPPMEARAIDAELEAWREVAQVAAASDRLNLVVWTGSEARRSRTAATLLDCPSPRVRVKHDVSWDVTRPRRARHGEDLDEVLAAVEPVWTFYAAKLLSPALSTLLEPFGLLDDLEDDPAARLPSIPGLEAARSVLLERWQRHRLPAIPGLRFAAVPVGPAARPSANRSRTSYGGSMDIWQCASADLERAVELATHFEADGVDLEGPAVTLARGEALALLPLMPDQTLDASVLEVLAPHGLTTLRPKRPGSARPVLALRVQQVTGLLLGAAGETLARGVAHLNYVQTTVH